MIERSGALEAEVPPMPPFPPATVYLPGKSTDQKSGEVDKEMLGNNQVQAGGTAEYGYQFDWESPPKRSMGRFKKDPDFPTAARDPPGEYF